MKRLCVVREMPKHGQQCDFRPELFQYHQFTVVLGYGTYAAKEVLGTVPVEDDGSAFFQVPAGLIYFMALDAEGGPGKRTGCSRSAPGEVQGCVGCHEPRSLGPAFDRTRGGPRQTAATARSARLGHERILDLNRFSPFGTAIAWRAIRARKQPRALI